MIPSNDRRMRYFEGIEHTWEDLRRRYKNSTIEVTSPALGNTVVFMPTAIDEKMIVGHIFRNGKWSDLHTEFIDNVIINREYPRVGLVNLGKSIYLVSRTNQRQWRRGANDATMSVECIYNDVKNRNEAHNDIVLATAFGQKYLTPETFAEYIAEGDMTVPKVINNRMWMKSRDNYLSSLYFEDIFVGMFDRNKKFIPCKESSTLVEEMLNEFGLQQI